MNDNDTAMRAHAATNPMPEFDDPAFVKPRPLSEATVAIVTSAALHTAGDTGWGPMADPQFKVLDIQSYYEELAVELAGGPPGPWAAERWFFDETEAGKTVLATRRAMKATEAPFPLWFYMAPATRS